MARKLFISVLGAGFYENCVYVQDDFKSSQTRFIQQATLSKSTVKAVGLQRIKSDFAYRQSPRGELGGHFAC